LHLLRQHLEWKDTCLSLPARLCLGKKNDMLTVVR
jgi:hypothetical protein